MTDPLIREVVRVEERHFVTPQVHLSWNIDNSGEVILTPKDAIFVDGKFVKYEECEILTEFSAAFESMSEKTWEVTTSSGETIQMNLEKLMLTIKAAVADLAVEELAKRAAAEAARLARDSETAP